MATLCVKRSKAFAEIIYHAVTGEQVKDLFSCHRFGCPIFFDAESNE